MSDLAALATKVGGWEVLARELYQALIPYIEMERVKKNEQEGLRLGKMFGSEQRGRQRKQDIFLGQCVLDLLQQSKNGKPYESPAYHWQKVARELYPNLSDKNEDKKIKTLRNIASEYKRHLKVVAELVARYGANI